MTKTSPGVQEVAKPEGGGDFNAMPMSNPTFKSLQHPRRRRRSGALVTVGALLFVAAIGAAGLYALTRSHAVMGSNTPPAESQAASPTGPG